MKTPTVYDIIGIGVGPFNLGLAALADNIPDLKTKFFDSKEKFDWHPGLLMPDTRLQVPFYADLVTLADPTNPFSFMNFLKQHGRMFSFAISENNFITRFEYNQYCRWVVAQLPNIIFGMTCEAIRFSEEKNYYEIFVRENDGRTYVFHGKNIVIGVGTIPSLPDSVGENIHPLIFHSSDYLFKKEKLLQQKNITLVGSGQSAAEIFYNLLNHTEKFESLLWCIRSEYIFPMDNSKFAYEMSAPDYISYFFDLPESIRQKTLAAQNHLYKGINKELIDAIYNRLYLFNLHRNKSEIKIHVNAEFEQLTVTPDDKLNLQFFHKTEEKYFDHHTDAAIFATGYKYATPEFIDPIKRRINYVNPNPSDSTRVYSVSRNYSIDNNNSIFVQNADLQSHGFNSADLGLGPYRNASILNTVLGRVYFKMENNITFQNFGTPGENL